MYARHNPAPPLSAFVECFWYWEGSAGTAERERLLPTGQGSVIFNLLDDAMRLYSAGNLDSFESYSSAMWAGALSTPNIIDNQQKDRVFGIQFRSGGVYPFVKMPVDDSRTVRFRSKLSGDGQPQNYENNCWLPKLPMQCFARPNAHS